MRFLTQLVNPPACEGDSNHPTVTPLYQTVTFAQDDAAANNRYNYSRSGNPTREVLEKHIAKIEGAKHALTYVSGIAATNAVTELLSAGDEVITHLDIYGGSYRLFHQVLPQRAIKVKQVDTKSIDQVRQAITPHTKLIWLETPSNPLLEITDIAAIAAVAKPHKILVAVDNSLLAHLQKPLTCGADLIMYSATKHFSGHSDVTAGAVVVNEDALAERLRFQQNATGVALPPFDAWLLLRGIKTMGIRMQQQQASAAKIVSYLLTHPLIVEVYYPRMGEVGYEIHQRQAQGAGCVFSVLLSSEQAAKTLVNQVKLFYIAASFGCVHSFISIPRNMSHASVAAETAPSPRVVRFSIGIEDCEDLIADLEQALAIAAQEGQ